MYINRFGKSGFSISQNWIIFILIGLILFCVGGFIWEYTINSWLEFLGKLNRVEWWQVGLLAVVPVLRHLTLPAWILTWLALTFFLV